MTFKTDWFKIIAALERAKLSHKKIGDELGRSATAIQRYKDGSEPKHCDGEKLLELYRVHCGNSTEMQST